MATSYPNPYGYTSPIGAAFANLTKTLMSGPTQAEKIKGAEEALKLKRTRENTDTMADLFGQYNSPGFDRNALAAAAVRAGYDPSDAATMERYLSANTHGATDARTDNAFVGAGGAYSSTGGGFLTDQANTNQRAANALAETVRNNDLTSSDRRYGVDKGAEVDLFKFNNEPKAALRGGVPSFVPQASLTGVGVAPIITNTENQATEARRAWGNLDDLTPAQSRYIGSDETDNSEFGTSEIPKRREEVLNRRVAVGESVRQIKALDGMLAQPNADGAIGVLGTGAGLLNGIASQAQAALRLTGITEPENIRSLETYLPTLQALGVQNAQIQSAIIDLAYTLADAREGGQKSTQDIDNAIRTIGGALGDPVAMRAVLSEIQNRKLSEYDAYEAEIRNAYGDRLNLPPPSFAGTPPLAAPAPSGAVVQVSDEAGYNALPPGAQYRDPQGNLRTKGQ